MRAALKAPEGAAAPLSHWRLSAYAALTIPLAAAGLPVAIYVAPLYTDHVGLSLTIVGLALMATRVFDIIVDPLVGRLSDATYSPFGRRIPWIVLGTPIMMFGVWRTFLPSGGETGMDLFVLLLILYVGWAFITVPYGAWGAELSPDYHERSRIAGARELFSAAGLLVAVTFPLVVRPSELAGIEDRAAMETAAIAADVAMLGWATLVLLPLLVALLVVCVPIVSRATSPPDRNHGLARGMLGNKPFLLLFFATFLAGLATGMNQTTVIYYYRYRAGLGDYADVMIFVFFGAAVLGAVLWMWVGRRYPKHHAMAAASLMSLVASLAVLAVSSGDVFGFTLVQVASGIAYAGPLMLGASMAADVTDLDWLKSGVQRGALFISIWGIGKKLSEAAGVGIALPLLEGMGFSAETAATPSSQTALIVVNVLLPGLFAFLAIPFILAHPLNERRQKVVRAAIARKLGRERARRARSGRGRSCPAGAALMTRVFACEPLVKRMPNASR